MALASNMWLRKALTEHMAAFGVSFKAQAKNLGLGQRGAGPVKERGRAARTKRRQANAARKGKLRKAARWGAQVRKVTRRGILPSLQYGHRAVGLAPNHVLWLQRTIADSLPGRHYGRSRHLRLAIFKADPAPRIAADTIGAWAAAIWDRTTAPSRLRAAWMKQACRMMANRRWANVVGPAGACRMTAEALGWKAAAWNTFITRDGLRIGMRRVCPRDVRSMAERDHERAQWAAGARHKARSTTLDYISTI